MLIACTITSLFLMATPQIVSCAVLGVGGWLEPESTQQTQYTYRDNRFNEPSESDLWIQQMPTAVVLRDSIVELFLFQDTVRIHDFNLSHEVTTLNIDNIRKEWGYGNNYRLLGIESDGSQVWSEVFGIKEYTYFRYPVSSTVFEVGETLCIWPCNIENGIYSVSVKTSAASIDTTLNLQNNMLNNVCLVERHYVDPMVFVEIGNDLSCVAFTDTFIVASHRIEIVDSVVETQLGTGNITTQVLDTCNNAVLMESTQYVTNGTLYIEGVDSTWQYNPRYLWIFRNETDDWTAGSIGYLGTYLTKSPDNTIFVEVNPRSDIYCYHAIDRSGNPCYQYEISSTEITEDSWNRTMHGTGGSQHPKAEVSVTDCLAYCEMLNRQDPFHYYTLPYEGEWILGYGSAPNYANIDRLAWHGGNASSGSMEVGKKLASPTGTYDMLGNLSEWCMDQYYNYAGEYAGSLCKGGSWGEFPNVCNLQERRGMNPEATSDKIGFRVVRFSI